MNSGGAGYSSESPAEVYSRHLKELQSAQETDQRRERRLGYIKTAMVVAVVALGFLFLRNRHALEALPGAIGLFVALAVVHERILQAIGLRARAIHFYERGLARLENRWAGTGETGDRFFDPAHPYARDLDIFGKASVFELLCTVRTRAGEETLASWLLAPAPVEEILSRQNALQDLSERLRFREDLSVLGESVRLGLRPEALSCWGERKPIFAAQSTQITTTVLALFWALSLVCWWVWGVGIVAGTVTVLNVIWAYRIRKRLDEACSALEKASEDLRLLAGVLKFIEQARFSSPKLIGIQRSLLHNGEPPSKAIRKLARIANCLESRRNLLARLPDLVIFWSAQFVFAAERWQRQFGPEIRGWLAGVGEFEALSALSSYKFEHPEDVLPLLCSEPVFQAVGIAHPLLPASTAVRNDVKLDNETSVMILSGPNMAGKSTFIRAIGVNAILAQCGAPVRASRLCLSPFAVAASICVLDSLSGGVSRFYAEIHRIKLISDLTQGDLPVLFLLDELLSGTNSHDRLEGTKFLVQSLVDRGAIGIVSTHDLALAQIPESMGKLVANFHFEDRFEDSKLLFDYKLKAGIVKTSNALELMRSIGLGIAGGSRSPE